MEYQNSRTVQLREAVAADAGAILDCLRAAFKSYEAQYTPDAFRDTVLDGATIGERLKAMTVFVAVNRDGKIVGTLGCGKSGDAEGHLRGMAVYPEWRGTGLAAQLLTIAEGHLIARGCDHVTLDTTEPLERAMRFYERHGYQRTGNVSEFFGMKLVEYRKDIPQ